ncbi:hypothetical protein C8R43DRAFT_919596 [Mycena crocata]|nr:hypothetical protein C8R43DRAFT_919596 [Mycena crocata]
MNVDASEEGPDVPDLTRAEGLWFEDCGLIIQAERTIFRISRDFLAMRSPIFADMLSMPSPANAETMYGCPFVLVPDNADDITCLLKALLYHEFFEPSPASVAVLSSVLRMSDKYEIDTLRKRALIHLSSIYPTKLSEWDALDMATAICSWKPALQGEAMEIGQVGRQVSALWILPVAFYDICHEVEIKTIISTTSSFHLSPGDRASVATAIPYLRTTCTSKALQFLWDPASIAGCVSPTDCSAARFQARFDKEQLWAELTFGEVEPDSPLSIWATSDWDGIDVCDICMSAMKDAHHAARQSLWDELPKIFGLPNWTELEKMKAEALSA